jgi:hypothetical protein
MKKLFFPACLLALTMVLGGCDQKEFLFNEMVESAKLGNPVAQYHLGEFYLDGIGTEPDRREALRWFEIASGQGDALASYRLGRLYHGEDGAIVPIDLDKAARYYTLAADAGHSDAQYEVGLLYRDRGDMVKAASYFRQAARQGQVDAIRALSQMLAEGEGGARDLGQSYFYAKLAERLDPGQSVTLTRGIGDLSGMDMFPAAQEQAGKLVAEWRPEPSMVTQRAALGVDVARQLAVSLKR